jgi:hypothetical protein
VVKRKRLGGSGVAAEISGVMVRVYSRGTGEVTKRGPRVKVPVRKVGSAALGSNSWGPRNCSIGGPIVIPPPKRLVGNEMPSSLEMPSVVTMVETEKNVSEPGRQDSMMPVGQVKELPGGEAGREKVVVVPLPMRTKSSMVSAWALRGRVQAEARRARVKREFLME